MVASSEPWVLVFPAGTKILTANEMRAKGHWSKFYTIIKSWRAMACLLAQQQKVPLMEKVKIRAVYHPPDNRRRDTSNIFPTIKAAVDGIVDAGVLKDDSDKYVLSVEMVRGSNVALGQLVIEIIEVT